MSDTKISALTSGNPSQPNDQVPINRAGVNFSITAGSIAALGSGLTPATFAAPGALSQAAVTVTGSPITGGTGITTFPLVYINSGVTAPTTFNVNGTVLAINAPLGFTGDLFVLYTNGVSRLAVTSGGGLVITSSLAIGGAVSMSWNARSKMFSPADGVIEITNQAGTDFGRLQFGGTTSSFPSLKRSATTLQCRLADDSADAPLSASNLTASGNLITATQTPASAAAAGTAGTIAWDSGFVYICTATNTWKRAVIATW